MKAMKSALLLVLALCSCQAFTPSGLPERWVGAELSVGSERILWEVTVLSLEKHGFPMGTGLDPAGMQGSSGWQNNLAPFRGQGYRERAHVRYQVLGPNRYNVEVRVENQANMDITRPLDARYAKWEPAEDDEEQARVILQRIRAWIGQSLDVGDRPRPGSGDGGS